MAELPSGTSLRKIAAQTLQTLYPGRFAPDQIDELVKSVVRQWQQYDGHAGLIFQHDHLWMSVTPAADGLNHVGAQPSEVGANLVELFLQDWDFEPTQIPAIVHALNLRQRAEFRNRTQERLCLHVDPAARSLRMEKIPADA